MTIAEKLTAAAENMAKVYEAGKKAERDAFWDLYQDYGARTNYATAYGGLGWTAETFTPKYSMVIGDGYMMFRNHNSSSEPYDLAERLETLGVEIGWIYTGQYMFYNANVSRIPPLDFRSGTKAMSQTFYMCKAVTIDKILVTEQTTYSSPFYKMESLENVLIDGVIGQNGFDVQWATKLSKASITSIINALSGTTSGLTVTLSKTAVETAFTTDEWAALAGTKPNWTISLV